MKVVAFITRISESDDIGLMAVNNYFRPRLGEFKAGDWGAILPFVSWRVINDETLFFYKMYLRLYVRQSLRG